MASSVNAFLVIRKEDKPLSALQQTPYVTKMAYP
jgi:hypothetical protein